MELTRSLAEYVVQTGSGDLPPEAVTQAKRAVLDTLGVMIAGSVEPCARIAADLVRSEAGRPIATVVGQGFSAPPRSAALVNGTATHALDYDDVTQSMRGHPSPPLLPALLAVGEEQHAAGVDLLTAFVLGFEVECRIGRGLGESHYPHGWHATATLGVLGAAVVAAKLYRLDVQQTRMALGVAASLAGGLRQNFGTMTKPLHPGNAAHGGILAAQLAARGFEADAEILEAPLGFLNAFSTGDARPERVLDGIGSPFEIVSPGISVKQYPCCYGTHRALDAVLALREERRVEADQIERIEVTVPRGAAAPLIHPRPQTGLEGKFSMQYCMATALLDGRVVLDSFRDSAVKRPEARALLQRVELIEAPEPPANHVTYADVAITLRDGSSLHKRVDAARGAPDQPLSWDELAAKYRDCAARVIGAEATERSVALIAALERLGETQDLTGLLLGQPADVRA
jgi:2-methylcitrate dehydratase PrpD